jgi:transcription elongation factor GreA
MANVEYMSASALEKLKRELKELKTVKRREVAARIEAAKALGDLSENAEYHEAKDELALLEGRISQLEETVANAAIIGEQGAGEKGTVRVGSTIVVKVGAKEKTFTIVGSTEADPAAGRISNESPIGSALLGAKVGVTVLVESPSGKLKYEVVEVR